MSSQIPENKTVNYSGRSSVKVRRANCLRLSGFWQEAYTRLIGVCLLVFLAGCYAEPVFDFVPAIEFREIARKNIDNVTDSVIITIAFQDGDGDLGLSGSESDIRYRSTNLDGSPNRFFNNYFIEAFRQENGQWNRVNLPSEEFTFSGRFPILNTNGGTRPLEGDLIYRFELFYGALGSPFNGGDTLRFEVQIADRALNLSNLIVTDPLVIGVGD